MTTNMNSDTKKTGTFLNGRAQIVDMLQALSPVEKKNLLHEMMMRNPQLTKELSKQSLTFDYIQVMPEQELRSLLNEFDPQVLGLALKDSSPEMQRRILSLLPRPQAMVAYEILIRPMENGRMLSQRAQKKILHRLSAL